MVPRSVSGRTASLGVGVGWCLLCRVVPPVSGGASCVGWGRLCRAGPPVSGGASCVGWGLPAPPDTGGPTRHRRPHPTQEAPPDTGGPTRHRRPRPTQAAPPDTGGPTRHRRPHPTQEAPPDTGGPTRHRCVGWGRLCRAGPPVSGGAACVGRGARLTLLSAPVSRRRRRVAPAPAPIDRVADRGPAWNRDRSGSVWRGRRAGAGASNRCRRRRRGVRRRGGRGAAVSGDTARWWSGHIRRTRASCGDAVGSWPRV